VSHGKNKKIVEQLKQILTYGGFKPVVSQENETTSKPVPEKVMDDMRASSFAVIHVSPEKELIDENGERFVLVNQNVLIEIGASMALHKNRFVLLVEDGVNLPSNLQGMYECRYKGDSLDFEATMKLLKAFNDFKKAA
jgi:predicted nucleotide-binding protein